MNIFEKIWNAIDTGLKKLNFDGFIINLYDKYVSNLHELFKFLLVLLLAVIIILGTISFIKKMFKVFIVLIIAFIAIIWASKK